MPYRDAAGTIDAALRSMLAQTHRDLEVLAIDDGSVDDSRRRVEAIASADDRVRALGDGRRLGLPRRLNQGIDAASGTLIARMDADDAAHPDRLARQAAALAADDALDLVGSAVVVLSGDEPTALRRFPAHHESIMRRASRGVPIAHPTFLGRTAWFRRHRYDERFERAQDQELLLRAAPTSRYANLERPLLGYREPSSPRAAAAARRFRRRAVRLHRGGGAAFLLWLRDLAAALRPARGPRGVIALPPEERPRWRELARSGRWPDHDSPS